MICIERFPLTANGKLDTKKLPEPVFVSDDDDFEDTSSEREEAVRSVFATALNRDPSEISATVSFLRIGGDSISAMRVSSLLKQRGLHATVAQILKHKTVRDVATCALSATLEIDAEQGDVTGDVVISPVQMWFLEKSAKNVHHFNQSFVLKGKSLDVVKLQSSIDKIIAHHDMLRARFSSDFTAQKNLACR